jgi:hypothetical protein
MRSRLKLPDDDVRAGIRAAAAAFLLANALKPRVGESFVELLARAERTSPERPNGQDPLADLQESDPVRAAYYAQLIWTPARLPLAQMRVWPGMDGLPRDWCVGAVPEVAAHVGTYGIPESAHRMAGIWALTRTLEKSVLVEWLMRIPLLAIPDTVFSGVLNAEGSPRRALLPGAPWTLDDGCTRAVVLSLLGISEVLVMAGHESSE